MSFKTPEGKLVFTYLDLIRHSPPDSWGYELHAGDLVVHEAPGTTHGRVVMTLAALLEDSVGRNGLGEVFVAPVDVVLEETTVLQPDLLVVARGREQVIAPKAIQGAPDWVIEVLSEGTRRFDQGVKSRLYLEGGVREVWLVDPESRSIQVLKAGGTGVDRSFFATGDVVVTSATLPVEIRVEDIFARLPPLPAAP